MRSSPPVIFATLATLFVGLLAGCPSAPTRQTSAPGKSNLQAAVARGAAKIQGVNLSDGVRPAVDDSPIVLGAAKNEWASFSIQISNLAKPTKKAAYSFRIQPPRKTDAADTIDVNQFSGEQILPMPVDVNRAGFVRHTGLSAASRPLPRALLPVTMDRGVVNLSSVRDPANATDPQAHPTGAAEPLLFWIDLHIPAPTPPGEYVTSCDLFGSDSPQPLASVPVKITVYDFVVPDERHLVLTSRLNWHDLTRLYPEFETVRPQLISRSNREYDKSIATLDSLVKLAQQHRVEITIPRLQPVTKWLAGRPPQVDWTDLDGVLAPWLSGDAFADKIPIGCWPLPATDYLDRYDRRSQLEYWSQAATHFDQKEWLNRAPVAIESAVPGRVGGPESIQMSADAAQILKTHPRVRVTLPLEEDQVQLASASNADFVDPRNGDRLLTAAPGIVFNTPIQKWPSGAKPPRHWLRTDLPGLVQYVGAGGDERDTRVWAWLAFRTNSELIQWDSPLPRTNNPREMADPNDLVWFYPGSWFGVDHPLATIQLKWLRRAQQDYEYLWLAKQRGEVINALMMARLMTKPVEIAPGQIPDPTYALLTGTADPAAWTDGQRLLAKIVLLREPGQNADKAKSDELALQLLRWIAPQDRAIMMGRTTDWGFAPGTDKTINLTLGLDIYNASDTRPDQNRLQWTAPPRGFNVDPRPITLPALATYRVERFATQASFDVSALDVKDRTAGEILFVNGENNRESRTHFVIPVAPTDRLGPGLKIEDGKLDDWSPADMIASGPLVRMFNRPALQKQEIQFADEQSNLYTGWGDESFYIAFRLHGVTSDAAKASRNFVDYQFRRAWGEDLAEILIQPIFADGALGPVLHVVCKPTAGHWVERKRDPRMYADPWSPLEGIGIRYTARTSPDDGWTGELAIPWRAITDNNKTGDKTLPKLLRFNFSQHVHSTGQSASWAGPVDFGRDDSFTGLLVVRESTDPGMAGPTR